MGTPASWHQRIPQPYLTRVIYEVSLEILGKGLAPGGEVA